MVEIGKTTTRLQLLAKFDKIGMYWKDMVTPQTQGHEEELGTRKDRTMSGPESWCQEPMSWHALFGQIDLSVFSLCTACFSFWLPWTIGDVYLTSGQGRQETLINRPVRPCPVERGESRPKSGHCHQRMGL